MQHNHSLSGFEMRRQFSIAYFKSFRNDLLLSLWVSRTKAELRLSFSEAKRLPNAAERWPAVLKHLLEYMDMG